MAAIVKPKMEEEVRRIKERRYGRGPESVPSITGTHRIKIGWKTKSKNGSEIPCKLNGFLICRNRMDREGRLEIDFEAMAALGHAQGQIHKGIAEHFNAPDGCLPDTLHFVVMRDAFRGPDGDWRYPNTLAASYQLYGKEGLMCVGDGCMARRKQADGTQKEIPCIPFGKEGADPKSFCPFSGPNAPDNSKCRDKFYFAACLFYITDNGPRPLFPELGMNSLAVLETTSEYCDMDAFDNFDAAADRLKGNLCGITGTLRFGKRDRRTGGNGATAKARVGHVYIALDEESILQRERMLRGESAIGRTEILSIGAGHSIPAIEHKPSPKDTDVYPAEPDEPAEIPSREEQQALWDEADGALADEEEAAPAEVNPEKAEAVEQLIKMADSADVDLLPILKKAGVEVPDELSLDQIQKTMAWLSRQLDKRLAGVAK